VAGDAPLPLPPLPLRLRLRERQLGLEPSGSVGVAGPLSAGAGAGVGHRPWSRPLRAALLHDGAGDGAPLLLEAKLLAAKLPDTRLLADEAPEQVLPWRRRERRRSYTSSCLRSISRSYNGTTDVGATGHHGASSPPPPPLQPRRLARKGSARLCRRATRVQAYMASATAAARASLGVSARGGGGCGGLGGSAGGGVRGALGHCAAGTACEGGDRPAGDKQTQVGDQQQAASAGVPGVADVEREKAGGARTPPGP
jgi:hypothetical protein